MHLVSHRLAARLAFPLLFVAALNLHALPKSTGPWDLKILRKTPEATWGSETGMVRSVYFQGEPFNGQPTRVFAYYARPEKGKGPFPAMVLVHGGGGKAFPDWAKHWAGRGYVAIAMDLSGNGPDGKRLSDGAPDQSDPSKFREFTASDVKDMWTYHAVAAVVRAHSLLAAQREVDRRRIGITGISWGGYLTCIVAGIDDRLKVAVPVYGCGFLDENSCWLGTFEKMTAQARTLWSDTFDPSRYLGGVDCPILFLNGSNDFAYPLDSYKKSYGLVNSARTISVRVRLPHGHIWTFNEVDLFVDSALKRGVPLPKLTAMNIKEGTATATVSSRTPLAKAELHYTVDSGAWQKRLWKSEPAELKKDRIVAPLPAGRPLVCFLTVTDERGVSVSTQHEELAEGSDGR